MDIAGRYSALLMAVMNMAGIAGALLMPIALGYLIGPSNAPAATGTWCSTSSPPRS